MIKGSNGPSKSKTDSFLKRGADTECAMGIRIEES